MDWIWLVILAATCLCVIACLFCWLCCRMAWNAAEEAATRIASIKQPEPAKLRFNSFARERELWPAVKPIAPGKDQPALKIFEGAD
jgi:hypothetical protein